MRGLLIYSSTMNHFGYFSRSMEKESTAPTGDSASVVRSREEHYKITGF
jgi:hypothetical protein